MSTRRLRSILAGLLQGIVGLCMFFAFVFTIDARSTWACVALLLSIAAGVLAMIALHPED